MPNFVTPDSAFTEHNPYHNGETGRFTTKTGAKRVTGAAPRATHVTASTKVYAVKDVKTPARDTALNLDTPDRDGATVAGTRVTDEPAADAGKGGKAESPEAPVETPASGDAQKSAPAKPFHGLPISTAPRFKVAGVLQRKPAPKPAAAKGGKGGDKSENVKTPNTPAARGTLALETAQTVIDTLRKKGVPDSDFAHLIGEVEKMGAHLKVGKLSAEEFDTASLALLVEALMASGEVSEQDAPAVAAKTLGLKR